MFKDVLFGFKKDEVDPKIKTIFLDLEKILLFAEDLVIMTGKDTTEEIHYKTISVQVQHLLESLKSFYRKEDLFSSCSIILTSSEELVKEINVLRKKELSRGQTYPSFGALKAALERVVEKIQAL